MIEPSAQGKQDSNKTGEPNQQEYLAREWKDKLCEQAKELHERKADDKEQEEPEEREVECRYHRRVILPLPPAAGPESYCEQQREEGDHEHRVVALVTFCKANALIQVTRAQSGLSQNGYGKNNFTIAITDS